MTISSDFLLDLSIVAMRDSVCNNYFVHYIDIRYMQPVDCGSN